MMETKGQENSLCWFQMMLWEIVLFLFIGSLREATFEMFVSYINYHPLDVCPGPCTLCKNAACFFPNLRDFSLHDRAVSLYKQFSDGHFTVNKTTHNFSNIAMDQGHDKLAC